MYVLNLIAAITITIIMLNVVIFCYLLKVDFCHFKRNYNHILNLFYYTSFSIISLLFILLQTHGTLCIICFNTNRQTNKNILQSHFQYTAVMQQSNHNSSYLQLAQLGLLLN